MADSILNVIINMTKKGTGDKQAQAGLKGLSDGFRQLTGFSLGSVSALAAVGMGLREVVKFGKEAVTETVAYNKTIREMTQVTGLGAEEISRIVQVGDDWGISIDTLRTSLAFMNKTGVTPSIDNLAILADEYVATSDKSAFAEKAVKLLGRGYQTLIPLLALGGKGLRDATGAVEDNLIATDASIKAAREYEVNVDKLTDAWTGFKQEVGNKVIPVLNSLLGGLNNQRELTKKLQDAVDDGIISTREQAKAIKDFRDGGKDYLTILNKINTATAKEYTPSMNRLAYSMGNAIDSTEDLTDETKKLAEAERIAKVASDKLNQAYDDMNSVINGQLGPEMEDFTKGQADLEKQMADVQTEIDTAITQGYDPLGEKVMGLKGDYDKLKGQYDDNATAHDEATKRIMFDILEQRAAIGGLTTDEVNMLQKIALQWGLTDQATLDYMNNADDAMNWLADHPGDVENAQKIIEGQATSWGLAKTEALLAHDAVGAYRDALNELDGKTVNTYINNWVTEHREGASKHPRQHGGPVSAGVPYLVGEVGPELFVPNTSGRILPNHTINNTNYFNMNVHTNASVGALSGSFAMMKAMAG